MHDRTKCFIFSFIAKDKLAQVITIYKNKQLCFARDKCLALLHDTFQLDMAKLDMLSGPMMTEAYVSFLIMLASLHIIKLPDWLPACYSDWRHCFET